MPVQVSYHIPMSFNSLFNLTSKYIINYNTSCGTAGVNETLSCLRHGRELGPQQGFGNSMTTIGHNAGVPIQLLIWIVKLSRHAVPAVIPHMEVQLLLSGAAAITHIAGLPHVPDLDALVFGVG